LKLDKPRIGVLLGTPGGGGLVVVIGVNDARGRVTGGDSGGAEDTVGGGVGSRTSLGGLEGGSAFCSLAASVTVARLCLGVELLLFGAGEEEEVVV